MALLSLVFGRVCDVMLNKTREIEVVYFNGNGTKVDRIRYQVRSMSLLAFYLQVGSHALWRTMGMMVLLASYRGIWLGSGHCEDFNSIATHVPLGFLKFVSFFAR